MAHTRAAHADQTPVILKQRNQPLGMAWSEVVTRLRGQRMESAGVW
jgi:hypothetical protein